MNHTELVAALKAKPNRAYWTRIAALAGVSYSTVHRVASGDISSPRVKHFEMLTAAVTKVAAEQAASA